MTILQPYGEAVMTSLGFFWKSAWAFVFGYAISAMIQAFVPQKALTRHLGGPGLQSLSLATVLNANGVMFAGIMGFIYSDLMVPPLVQVNAKYYGPRLALYIAGIMFVSIVITALLLHTAFSLLNIVPESRRVVSEIVRFKLDYTFWMNAGAVIVVFVMIGLRRRFQTLQDDDQDHHDHGRAWSPKRVIAALAALVLAGGTAVQLMRLTL